MPARSVRPFSLTLSALLLALLFAVLLRPAVAQAGTVTIVDGTAAPSGGTYTDGWVQDHLNITGSLTISTTGIVSGPDDILVQAGAEITWTTGFSLTLLAERDIVVTGILQHDGPESGAGGLQLLANGDNDTSGAVIVGTGLQTSGVAAGSRHGLTRVDAVDLVLQGGNLVTATNPFAMLGFRVSDPSTPLTVTGPISVTVSRHVTATGGSQMWAFVQVGHGGGNTTSVKPAVDENFVGPVAMVAGGNVTFQGVEAYAQLGNGGIGADGNHGGGHTLNAGGSVFFESGVGDTAYAQLGNGGHNADGNHSGSHILHATAGTVTFQGGIAYAAYAQLGNGGVGAIGNHSGGHSLQATAGDVIFRGAQMGNGGTLVAFGTHSGDHTLHAGGDVTFQGAQLGNGGDGAYGNSGDHTLHASGDVTFQGGGGTAAYAQLGNGGYSALGSHSGSHTLHASGDVTFQGGDSNVAYAQLGNGGIDLFGAMSGSLALTTTSNLVVMAGSGKNAYDMLGHGSDTRDNPSFNGTGSRSGDLSVSVGATAVFSGAHVGHLTKSGIVSVTQGNTLVGVSQNDPVSGAGQLIATGVVSFTSASANGGELRLYLPRRDSQQIPTTTTFNGESFTTANTIPEEHIRGFYPFGDGPYAPNYSFYLGPAIAKTVSPTTLLRPGDPLTYTVSFYNIDTITTTNVIISDTLPTVLSDVVVTSALDTGVVITQTGSAPDLAWQVSDLGAGQGGRIIVTATISDSASLLGTTFTNMVSITNTSGVTLTANSASVSSNVIPPATIIITKVVEGSIPADDWPFAGSDPIGSFSLPAGGGSTTFSPLLPDISYTISETARAEFTPVVTCNNGSHGTANVTVTPGPNETIGCTFTNTYITQTLTVSKVVVGGPLSVDDFELFVDDNSVSTGVPTELAAGTHTVSESTVPTYTAAFSGDCDSEGVVNLGIGKQALCTITNTYITQTLTVSKVVVGGPLSADDFTLLVSGDTVTNGVPTLLAAGTYTVTESSVPSYTAAFSGDCNASGVVNLAIGEQALCTITNTYITQTLTVSKVVSDGPLSAGDFDLFVNGNPVTNGVALELPPGAYTVSESSVPTYTASFSGDCDASGLVNLAIGEQALCVLTNTFIPSRTGTVSGTVVDKGGSAIEGALVTLSNEAGVVSAALVRTESTDADGLYLFENVPAGTYSLTVAAQGYQTSDPVTVVVTADETTVVDAIVLQVGPTALDEEDMPAYPVIWLFLPVVADNSPAAARAARLEEFQHIFLPALVR